MIGIVMPPSTETVTPDELARELSRVSALVRATIDPRVRYVLIVTGPREGGDAYACSAGTVDPSKVRHLLQTEMKAFEVPNFEFLVADALCEDPTPA